jgi:hypothetical protein
MPELFCGVALKKGSSKPGISFQRTRAVSRAQALERILCQPYLGQQRARREHLRHNNCQAAAPVLRAQPGNASTPTEPTQALHLGDSDSQSETGNYRDQNVICQAPEGPLLTGTKSGRSGRGGFGCAVRVQAVLVGTLGRRFLFFQQIFLPLLQHLDPFRALFGLLQRLARAVIIRV